MDSQNNNVLIFQDVKAQNRIVGVLFAGMSGIFLFYFLATGQANLIVVIMAVGMIVVGLYMGLSFGDLTITADRTTRTLRLEYRNLLDTKVREISFDQIQDIHTERTFTLGISGRHSFNPRYTYRISADLKDGTTVPFRSTYTDESGQSQRAQLLDEFIKRKE